MTDLFDQKYFLKTFWISVASWDGWLFALFLFRIYLEFLLKETPFCHQQTKGSFNVAFCRTQQVVKIFFAGSSLSGKGRSKKGFSGKWSPINTWGIIWVVPANGLEGGILSRCERMSSNNVDELKTSLSLRLPYSPTSMAINFKFTSATTCKCREKNVSCYNIVYLKMPRSSFGYACHLWRRHKRENSIYGETPFPHS